MLGLLCVITLPRGAFAEIGSQEPSGFGGGVGNGGGGGAVETGAAPGGGVGSQEPSGSTGGPTSGAVSTGPAPGGVGGGFAAPSPTFSGGVNPAPAAPATATTAIAIETPGYGGAYGYTSPNGGFVALGNPQGGPISAAQAQALADQLGVDVTGNIQGVNVGLGRLILNLTRGIPIIGTLAGFASRLSPSFGPGLGAAALSRDAGRTETGTLADVVPVNLRMPVGLTGPASTPQSQGAVNPFNPPVIPLPTAGTAGGGGVGGGVPASILPTSYGSRQITTHPWYTLGLIILVIVVGYTAVTHWEQIKDWFVKVGDEVTHSGR